MYCSVVLFSRPLEPLSYSLRQAAQVGTIVQVPLGRQSCTGIITAVTEEHPAYTGTIRSVIEVVDPKPFISEPLMRTLRFMASYYQAPLGFCLRLAMPGGMMRAGTCRYVLPADAPEGDKKPGTLFETPEDSLLAAIREAIRMSPDGLTETEIKKKFKASQEQFAAWTAAGTIVPHWTLDQKRMQESTEALYRAVEGASPKRLGSKQQEVYGFIAESETPVRHSAIVAKFGSCMPVLRRLEEIGLIASSEGTRDKTSFDDIAPIVQEVGRTDEQEEAVAAIVGCEGFGSFLLFGVTGSGKTEVYLGAMEAVRRRGKGCLFILPEIALTPQFCAVFRGRFGNDVAVLHSELSERERFDTWCRIRDGRTGIVIGPRSALFAPVQDLGLIVIDEEHDGSFKQGESPRYHARDMALYLGAQCKCPVVLGSATPSMESYCRALQGKMTMLRLTRRPQARPMPSVSIIDMRNRPAPEYPEDCDEAEKTRIDIRSRLLSQDLIDALHETVSQRNQAMVFLNRRGFSTFIQCSYCGHVLYCPNCDVALTYYKYSDDLHCHYCDYVDHSNGFCPKCGRRDLSYTGYGTERLVEVLQREIPDARIDRLDRDRASTRGIQNILAAFRAGEIDILVGTQMIAKGHDIHNVTLVGIVNADMGLHMPDFRASERTYQLLTQVSGRAGRGDRPGRVILQTLRPEHPAICGVLERDFASFAAQELEIRRTLLYPPYAYLVLFHFEGESYSDTENLAVHVAQVARTLLRDMSQGRVLGPAPAPIPLLCGKARYQLFLRHIDRAALHRWVAETMVKTAPLREHAQHVKCAIDVDPYDML